MPTYEYRCKKCSYEFEAVQKMTDTALTSCPECSGLVKRLIGTGAGIIFKGSGFYCTDYRSDSYNEKKSKVEAKPEDKTKAKTKVDASKKSETSSKKEKIAKTGKE